MSPDVIPFFRIWFWIRGHLKKGSWINSVQHTSDIPSALSEQTLLGCAVIFALKRNEAKRKRNFFRFDAKKSDFFACFTSMRNIEIWSETKMKQSENKTKKEAKLPSFSLRSKMKRNGSEIIFASMRKKVYENEIKRKKQKRSENFKGKKDKLKFWDNL